MSLPKHLTIVGAGLAGALLATLLAKRGWQVDVFERRGDPRVAGYGGGRSINLALAERGLRALRSADAADAVLDKAVMMRGRMVHFLDGSVHLQRYGCDDSEVIWSVSRGDLNITLIAAAEAAGARVHFDRRLDLVDFDARIATFSDGDVTHHHRFTTLVGADGAGSTLRQQMDRVVPLGERIEGLGHGYKELEIPPCDDGSFAMEPNALHLWPRGRYMCIALPNDGRTFTVTLFLPNHPEHPGGPSFETIVTGEDAMVFFQRDFADALPLIPDLARDFEAHPAGTLGTLSLERWSLDDRAVLLGDAAHAMVPFHGQGMNCAFEDCVALAQHIENGTDLARAFAAFEAERRPNAQAIQHMALENYLEMRQSVDDADFLLQRALERELADRFPDRFVPRYAMVTFRRIAYATALERGRVQRELLIEATQGLASLDGIDWPWLDCEVERRLSVLPAA